QYTNFLIRPASTCPRGENGRSSIYLNLLTQSIMRPMQSFLYALAAFPILYSVTLAYPRVETREVSAGLNDPISLAADPEGMLWLLERGGSVFRVDPQTGEKVTVLHLPGLVESRGAYGMTIDRDFSDSSW